MPQVQCRRPLIGNASDLLSWSILPYANLFFSQLGETINIKKREVGVGKSTRFAEFEKVEEVNSQVNEF